MIYKGKLKREDYEQLGCDNPKYNTRDIPLRITEFFNQRMVKVSNCYMGIQYREGGMRSLAVDIQHFVNDGFAFWTGDIAIDYMKINNDLPFKYTPSNHNDSVHGQTKKLKQDVIIRKLELHMSGKGVEDKGNFILSETGINDRFRLFSKGYKIHHYSRFRPKQPAFNANNLRRSSLGSADIPLDGKKLNGLPIRIIGNKPGSPKCYGNVIHCFDDVRLELDNNAQRGTKVRIYKRSWSAAQRRENWSVAEAAMNLSNWRRPDGR